MANTIETALRAILVADATTLALVSNRVYPGYAPASATPDEDVIIYQQISGPRLHDLDGPDGMVTFRFQFDCLSPTMPRARALADAVRGALDGYAGTSDSVVIGSTILDDERDVLDAAASNEPRRRFGKSLDFMVMAQE